MLQHWKLGLSRAGHAAVIAQKRSIVKGFVGITTKTFLNKDFEEGFKDLFQNIYRELFHIRRTRREEVGIHLFQKSNR